MRATPVLALAGALLGGALLATPAHAQGRAAPDAPAAPVLAVVQRLFDAMAARDTAAVRALVVRGTRFVAMGSDDAGATPRAQTDSAFVQMLSTRPDHLLERFWSPVAQIDGPIATVWAPYDFWRDGKWSHCGIDVVTLLRTGAGWQVAGLVYTVQRQGCAPSPLGAPDFSARKPG